jgi:phage FluMu protein Com
MGIPNDNENFLIVDKKCPHCLEQGVEIWVILGKRCPRCNNVVTED